MKKFKLGFILIVLLPLLAAALIAGCDSNTPDTDLRAALTAGPGVAAEDTDESAKVTFAGAEGVEGISADDFTVTGGATISDVELEDDTVTVTVEFDQNTTTEPRTFTVGINSASTLVKGSATVTVTQAGIYVDTRPELTAGSAVNVDDTDDFADVTFTGASGVEGLSAADFTVTGEALITGVSVASGTVTVTVEIGHNVTSEPRVFTVGISPDSTHVKGSATVTITQAAHVSGSYSLTAKIINQRVTPQGSTTPSNDNFLTMEETSPGVFTWAGNVSVVNEGTTYHNEGFQNATLLYIDDTISTSGYTFEARMTVTAAGTDRGIGLGVFDRPASIAGTGTTRYRNMAVLNHRSDNVIRHLLPRNDNVGWRADQAQLSGSNIAAQDMGTEYLYVYKLNGDGSQTNHYTMELRNASGTLIGARTASNADIQGTLNGAGYQLYPGILVFGTTAAITELKITINP